MRDQLDKAVVKGGKSGPPKKSSPSRARRFAVGAAKWLALALVGFVLALLLGAGVLAVRPGLVRPLLVRAAGAAGMELSMGEMRLEVWPLRLEARDVFLDTAPESTAQGRMRVRLRLPRALLEAAPDAWPDGAWLAELELSGPRLEALLPAANAGEGGEPFAWWRSLAALGRVRVEDGRARVAASWGVACVADFGAVLEPDQGGAGREFRVSGRASFDTAGTGAPLAGQALATLHGSVIPDGGLRVAFALSEGRVDAQDAAGLFEAQAEATLAGDMLDVATLDLRAREFELALPGGVRLAGLNAAVSGAGEYDLARGTFAVRDVALDAGNRLTLAGQAAGGPQGLKALRCTGRVADLALVLAELSGLFPRDLRDATCSGAVGFEATLDAGRLALGLGLGALKLRWPRHGLLVAVSGAPTLEGGWPGVLDDPWALGGTLEVRGDADFGTAALRAVQVRATLGGTLATPELAPLHLTLPAQGLVVNSAPLPLGTVKARAVVRRGADGAVNIGALDLTEERLGRFTGGMSWRPEGLAHSTARLRGEALQIQAVAALLADMGLLPVDFPAVSGSATVLARLEPRPGPGRGPARAVCDVALTDAGFATADGAWMADKGRGTLHLEAGLDEPRRVAARVALDQGELLLGTIYLDLAAMPLTLDAAADVADERALSGVRGRIALGGLAALELDRGRASGGADGWSWAGALTLAQADLPALLQTFLKDPLAFSNPEFAKLDASGALALTLEAERPTGGAVAVRGHLGLTGASLDYAPAGLSVDGLELDLPLAYEFGGAPPVPKSAGATASFPAPRGRLALASLTLPTGSARELGSAVELFANRLVLDGTLAAPLLGGTLRLSRIRVDDPLSGDFRATLAAVLERGDLAVLGTEQAPLEGSVSADFPVVSLTSQRLSAQGAATGILYGGQFRVEGLGVDKPLSRSRVAGCESVRLHLLDLERLSQALGIGRITGRLDLDLDGLRMAYGQPQVLRMELRSVPVDDVPQKVSLRAVNSISVVGTGTGLTGMGVGMFASFFKEFGYSALGIRCTLKNDVFSVRGLIREGGVEYLIKKPPLFGINVVNGNPDNRISFSDMVERVRRVLQSAPETGQQP